MTDKVEGYLEVGCNDNGEVVINHPDLKPDKDGVGHIVFTPNQARNLGKLLIKHADSIDVDATGTADDKLSEAYVDEVRRELKK